MNNNGNGHVRPPIGWTNGKAQDFAGGHSRMTEKEIDASYEVESRLIGVLLDTVTIQPVQWVWPNWIPAGKLSLLIGDPGLGKSIFTLDIAATISTGREWPGKNAERAVQGITILLTAEDGLADTVKPRIVRQGGDASRIWALQSVKVGEDEREFSLTADLILLEKQIEFLKDGSKNKVKLIVIDPLSAYIGDKDSYKDSEIRGLLRPLATLAEKHHVAILCILHMNKSGSGKAIYRALGSIAFGATARFVFGIAIDPNDKERRLVLPIKSNLAKLPSGLAYKFDENGKIVCEKEPVVDVNAESIFTVNASFNSEEGSDAEEFFKAVLGEGGRLPAIDIQRDARMNGISETTLNRTKRRLGIKSEKVRIDKVDRWVWYWPKDEKPGQDGRKMVTSAKMTILPKTIEKGQLDHDLSQDGHFSGSDHLATILTSKSESGTLNLASQKSEDAIASRDDENSKTKRNFRIPTTRKPRGGNK